MFKATLEIVSFEIKDIITTSGGLIVGGEGEGSSDNPMEFSLRSSVNINN